MTNSFDICVVGSGFGSLFFCKKFHELYPDKKILILEYGDIHDHGWQLENERNSKYPISDILSQEFSTNYNWGFNIGFGGGTNCWWGQTPRLMPEDFKMKTLYGRYQDWPVSYEDLEPFYEEAENIIGVSGDFSISKVSPRSQNYPLPHHQISQYDEVLMKKSLLHFPMPTARASESSAGRGVCCASHRCGVCPVDAKFTVHNSEVFNDLLRSENITLLTNREVTVIESSSGIAQSVVARSKITGHEETFFGDLFVLGANGINSPAILLRSGINHPMTGIGICEQFGFDLEVFWDGYDNFGGGTLTTSINYEFAVNTDRSKRASVLGFFENRPVFGLRGGGRLRQTLPIALNAEQDPNNLKNRVMIDKQGKPFVEYNPESLYSKEGIAYAIKNMDRIFFGENYQVHQRGERGSENHIMCSLKMGNDPKQFVVDGNGIHQNVRNLIIVGSSIFPTCPPAQPSLTVAALSLLQASRL